MGTYEIQHPNGQIITIESDKEPTQEDAQYLFGKINEQTLDAQESQNRFKKGLMGTALNTAVNAGKEFVELGSNIGNLANSVVKNVIFHPIKTDKMIMNALNNTSPEDAYKLVKGVVGDMVSETGKTFGYDKSRPGTDLLDKFDIDTALQKWEGKPLSSIGDLMLFMGAAKSLGKGAMKMASGIAGVKEATDAVSKATPELKKVLFSKLKQNGTDLKDMSDSVKYGMGEATAKPAKTPFENLLDHKDVIVGDAKNNIQSFNLKQLDDPKVAKDISVDISKKLLDISRNEKLAMNKALSKAENVPISGEEINILKQNINKSLVDNRLAEDVSQAFNFLFQDSDTAKNISPINKSSIKKFVGILDQASIGDSKLDVKSLKNILDSLDDTINWKDSKIADKGLKIIRGEIRNLLGQKVPQYGAFASRINKRLDMLGLAEEKLLYSEKNGLSRDFLEKLGLDIAKSDEKMKAFQEGLDIVKSNVDMTMDKDLMSLLNKNRDIASKAEGNIKALSGWKAWNDFIGQNENLWGQASRDISRNTNLPYVPRVLVDSVYKRGVKTALKLGKTPTDYASKTGSILKEAAKNLPYAASLSEKISNMNENEFQ